MIYVATEDGKVYSCGYGGDGRLGQGMIDDVSHQEISHISKWRDSGQDGDDKVVQIAIADYNSFFITGKEPFNSLLRY